MVWYNVSVGGREKKKCTSPGPTKRLRSTC